MREDRPSRTALRVAMRRAVHQILDSPRVFDDPFALSIIGPEAANAVRTGGAKSGARGSRKLRAFLVARSRCAEDELARAVARGVKQYVVLGAGLDTFAYRNPHQNLRVFEVDFPATQAWKRRRLQEAGIAIPESLTFAPVDFEKQTLTEGLALAGFRQTEAAFFSWLGVVPYLARETTLATLKLIISMCPANGIVFDYAVPRASLGCFNRMVFDALAKRVAAAGEPFVGFFTPEEFAQQLSDMGYRRIEDLDTAAINSRYFKGRRDRLRVGGGLAHIMCASGE